MTEIKGSFGRGRDAERRRRLDELQRLMSHLSIEEITRIFGALNTLAFAPACDAIRTSIDAARIERPVVVDIQAAKERMAQTIAANPPKPLLNKRYLEYTHTALARAIETVWGYSPVMFEESEIGLDFCVKLKKPRIDILLRTLTWNGRAFTVRTSQNDAQTLPDEWQAITDGTLRFMFCLVEDESETYVKETVFVDLFQLYTQSSQLKEGIRDRTNRDGAQFIECSIDKMPASVVLWRSSVG